jgi:DNA-directed RNA polymerase subunit beta'
VDIGTPLAGPAPAEKGKEETAPEVQPIVARFAGEASVKKKQLVISYAEKEEREYVIPSTASIWVNTDDEVKAGQQLTDGSINPHDILRILGKDAVQQYLVDEVQKIYRSQGVTINDKHIEVISHQMLTKVRIDSAGDTDLVPDELIDRFMYEDTNAKVLAEGGEPATAHTVLLGITRASLSTESWLAAASFQETTRILTEAAVNGKVDRLVGLKENVIIGKLIPARYLDEDNLPQIEAGSEEEELMRQLGGDEGDENKEIMNLLASLDDLGPVGSSDVTEGETGISQDEDTGETPDIDTDSETDEEETVPDADNESGEEESI